MATTYSCDRCHYDTRDHDNIATVSIPYATKATLRGSAPGGDYDLCDNCLKELRTFLRKKSVLVPVSPVIDASLLVPEPVPMPSMESPNQSDASLQAEAASADEDVPF